MENTKKIRQKILIFLIITFALSSIFYVLIISAGKLGAVGELYALGIMWCPGIAALITQLLYQKNISRLGWGWGKSRYQLLSYSIPFLYTMAAYLIVWTTELGGFFNQEFVTRFASKFGWESSSPGMIIFIFVLFQGTIGFLVNIIGALGEEIGWRGLLVPQLAKLTSFSNTALISGIIWGLWHTPLILFADYNSSTPAWYGLSCFIILIISTSFIFAWLRLKSGSLWTGVFLHASHNIFIQGVFTPLTTDTGNTKYFIDEFGASLAIVSIIVAVIFWNKRASLPKAKENIVIKNDLSST